MKLGLVTVPFIENESHFNLAFNSYKSFVSKRHVLYRVAVVNRIRDEKDIEFLNKYNDKVIVNDDNILARGWNKGISECIEADCDYILVPNLDVEFHYDAIDNLVDFALSNKDDGLWAMYAINDYAKFIIVAPENGSEEIKHHDQSFSSFLIHKDTFKRVGPFFEFKPAYFEDCDYLQRLRNRHYTPKRTASALFYHYGSGTVNGSDAQKKAFNVYLEENKKIYIERHGGIPNHETKTDI